MFASFFKEIFSAFRTAAVTQWLQAGMLLFFTIGLGYFTEQTQTSRFFTLSIPFFSLFLFVNLWNVQRKDVFFYLGIGIILRLVLLPSFPMLSDDIYRFIWDGHLLRSGISPFEHLPSYYAVQDFPVAGLNAELFAELNSPEYYTIYPPVAQLTFIVGTVLCPESWLGAAVVMRLFLFCFEVGSIFLLVKLFEHFKYGLKNILLYALNPLIIIEITGNLHFEGAMIFFLLLAFYLLVKNRIWLSAGAMALSIASKLLPLLFLPFLFARLGLDKAVKYFILIGVVLVVLFLPVTGNFFISHFGDSLDLYFRKFEFNASIYYLVRWVGYQQIGYNIIQSAGPILASLTFFGIVASALLFDRKASFKNWPKKMLFAICLYLLFTPTVHPWYVALPVVLCLFTHYRFPILWSGLIWLTYFNYSGGVYEEKLHWVAVEYSLVIAYALWEIFISRARHDEVYT